jgi:hypothetical protein
MTSTEFPNAERLLRLFGRMVWVGVAFLAVAVVGGVTAHGVAQALLLGTMLSGGLFFVVVGLMLRARGQRTLARLRSGADVRKGRVDG